MGSMIFPLSTTYLEVSEHVERDLIMVDKGPDGTESLSQRLPDEQRHQNGTDELDQQVDRVKGHVHAPQEDLDKYRCENDADLWTDFGGMGHQSGPRGAEKAANTVPLTHQVC